MPPGGGLPSRNGGPWEDPSVWWRRPIGGGAVSLGNELGEGRPQSPGPPTQLTLDPGARGTQARQRPARPESLARSTHWRGQHKDTRASAHFRVAGLGQHGTGRTLRGTGLGLGGCTHDAGQVSARGSSGRHARSRTAVGKPPARTPGAAPPSSCPPTCYSQRRWPRPCRRVLPPSSPGQAAVGSTRGVWGASPAQPRVAIGTPAHLE